MYLLPVLFYVHAYKIMRGNRMQNAADLGVFYQCEEYACMLHKI